MFVVLVHFEIHPGFEQPFHEAVKLQARNSVLLEEQCHVFDVCQSNTDLASFALYELYSDAQAFDIHMKSTHFLAFDQLVSPWVKNKAVQLLTRTGTGS